MSTKQSLAGLFEKAGLRTGAPNAHTALDAKKFKRELLCREFAEVFIAKGYDAQAAYVEFSAKHKRRRRSVVKQDAWIWMRQKRVLKHVRELVQEATESVKSLVRLDVAELVRINEALLAGDLCDYIEAASEWIPGGPNPADGTYRTFNRLTVNPTQLTTGQRMALTKITMKDGQVASVEIVDKLKAMAMQVALLELMQARDGTDTTWVGAFQNRMTKARQERIDAEVKLGKVLLMPAKKA